ncbi:MAG TPA: Uma2 family endonuclease, partial [Candidatus Competibacteraceae bacterium]|nr:Uma2 family endonuclease [Candidatus Competibacteraceae bacterium]
LLHRSGKTVYSGSSPVSMSQSRGKFRVRIQNPVRLGDHSEPEPDIAVVQNRSYRDAHPTAAETLLLIEVADTTLAYDRLVKTPLYARHGIPETWVLDVSGQRMECYRQPEPDGYQECRTFTGNAVLSPLCLPDVRVELAELW